MTAKLRDRRKKARKAMAALFPRGQGGVSCGPARRERHTAHALYRELAMRSPAEAIEHVAD
jgi:hypothetical protein